MDHYLNQVKSYLPVDVGGSRLWFEVAFRFSAFKVGNYIYHFVKYSYEIIPD